MKNFLFISLLLLSLLTPTGARASVILNEVGVQDIDFVELYNFGSEPISIQNYTLEFFSEGVSDFMFTLPDRILQPNSGVLEVTDLNIAALNRIFVGQDINWNATIDAAVVLRNSEGVILDYWAYSPSGNNNLAVMPGIFELNPNLSALPNIGNLINTHQRSLSPLSSSGFLRNRWTVGAPSRGVENLGNLKFNPNRSTPPPNLIINEVDPNSPDFVELFNHGCEAVNLSGYTVDFQSEFEGVVSFSLPDIVLEPNTGVLALSDSFGEVDPNSIFMGTNINWVSNGALAVVLKDPSDSIIDFMVARSNGGFLNIPAQLDMLPFQVLLPVALDSSYQRVGRRNVGNTYFAADWQAAAPSKGALNENQLIYPTDVCLESVLDFLPAIISGAIKQD